ncbi:calcium-binding protein [Ralstonia solanacearum species complex bacterium KE056]|uniref:calcium-binding protein n=1 Tax=Ralstonia solanacearum species complex bacterium KE056 TaxID=3119585 RepID=UPI002FC27E2D
MGIFTGGKISIGDVSNANTIKNIADDVRDAGVGAANNNNFQEAKSLSKALLDILGILSPVPGSKMTSDVAQESVNSAIDVLANRKKQIDDAIDAATGNNTDVGTGGGKGIGTDGGVGGSGGGSGAAGGLGGGGANAGAGATIPPRRDPLVLDLDGDGIETISTQNGAVIFFDHDADGVKTRTGWIKPDDGWLVLDRNGNGTIDSGRELFGVDTLKSNGQLASDGFDALKDLDANQDGKIDSADSVFADLRIWRDLNQDGISQANEMTALGANGITAIGVNSTPVRTDLGNGNVQTAAGTFTRSNGTTGTTGETNGAVANLDLLVNTFHRQFTDHITLTDQAKALPDMRGSGRVRDLSEAISLSTDLGNWVQTYSQQATRQGQIDRLDGFIEKWADTADMQSLKSQAEALSASGVQLTYNLIGLTAGTPAYDDFIRKLGVVERFMGFTYGGANGQALFAPLNANSGRLTVSLAAEQIANISLAYDRFKTDIYESLLTRTRLEEYVLTIARGISWDNTSAWINSTPFEQKINESIAENPRDGIIDLIEFVSAVGKDKFAKIEWDIDKFLITQLNNAPDLGAFTEELSSWTVRLAASTEHNLTGTSRPDFLVGTNTADYLYGRDGNDVLLGKGGNDTLYGGNGNDTLEGGAGNDYLTGEGGSDTYIFNSGWGQDTIGNYDAATGRSDVIIFGNGIAANDIIATRSGEDLILSLRNSTDRVTVQYYFSSDATGPYHIDQVRFADGTSWDVAAVKALVQVPTSGADNLYGYASDDVLNDLDGNDAIRGYGGNDTLRGDAGADTLSGGDGNDSIDGGADNDYLYGEAGNDSLVGGSGNDTLYGGNGNDTLEGGAGNDYLTGEGGSDTYVFNSGWGQDTIGNYDASSARSDVITFGDGIAASDIVATRSGEDLILSLRNSTDRVTVQYYFSSDATSPYRIDQVRFADGTAWDVAAVKALVQVPTSGADNLYGYASDDVLNGLDGNDTIRGYGGNDTLRGDAGADTLSGGDGNDSIDGGADNDYLYGEAGDDALQGGSGNDTLYGGVGNDTLEGGTGNDYLTGEGGSDTYVFNSGWGQDTIGNYDASTGRSDVIEFGSGIAANDVIATRSGEDLILSLRNSTDRVTVQYYFSSDATSPYRIDQVRFADGTSWDVAAVKALVQVPTSGNDNLYGYASDDVLNGLDGNDTIRGYGGNDTLRGDAGADTLSGGDGNDSIDGGADNDYLYGEAGDDALQGGSGNDTLYGGNGNDTLEGGSGNDYLTGEGGSDTYVFNSGWGQDTIGNYDASTRRSDVIAFGDGIATDQLWFRRVNADLEVSVIGSSDKTTISNWYSGSAYHVDQFTTAAGKRLLDTQVDSLVQAMSSFNPPASGQSTLPQNYQDALGSVIAANWK